MKIIKKITLIFLLIFLFLLPFSFTIANICLFGFIVGLLLSKDLYKNFSINKLDGREKFFLFISMFYVLWGCVSLLWTENYDRGFELTGRYTTIIVFPLLLILAKRENLIKKVDCLIWSFVFGVFVSSVCCLIMSYRDCWHETSEGIIFYFDVYKRDVTFWQSISGGFNYFSYKQLSHFINPAYYSLYFSLVVVFLIEKFSQIENNKLKFLVIVGIIYSVAFIYLLQNRGNIIALIFFLLLYFFLRKVKYALIFGCVIITIGIFLVMYGSSGRLSGTVSHIGEMFKSDASLEKQKKFERSNVRIIIWYNALQVIKENPILGVGIGDTDTELEQQYQKNNLDFEYGTHNQYIYAQLSMGIVGLFLLLAMLFVPLYYGIKNRYFPLIGFSVAVMINLLFENMLTRNAGLMFIPWAMMALLMMSEEKKKEISNE